MKPCLFPNDIEGKRLHIKRLSPEFAKQLVQKAKDEQDRIGQFMPWVQRAESADKAKEYLSQLSRSWEEMRSFEFAILDAANSSMVGGICIPRIDWSNDRCEVGYWIALPFEGQGYVSEALALLEKVIFQTGFNRIEILCAVNNPRSATVPERNTYKYEGTLREWFKVQGDYQDMRLYSKIRGDVNS